MTRFLILFFLQTFFVYEKAVGFDLEERLKGLILDSQYGFYFINKNQKNVTIFLDSKIQLCKAKDPKLNECVKQAGQKLLPLIADGIKEWNVSPIDPMLTPFVSFKDENKDRDLTINYTNLVQIGFSNTIIDNTDIDLQHGVLSFKLKYPSLFIDADYSTNGRIFDFVVEGNGKANITIWNALSSLVVKFHVSNDHIKCYSVLVGFSFDKIYLDYTNISFNGDKELSESASTFINENAVEIINGLKPQLEDFYGKIMAEFLQSIFDNVPYSVLFKNE